MGFDLEQELVKSITLRQAWLTDAHEAKAKLQPFLKPIKALLLQRR